MTVYGTVRPQPTHKGKFFREDHSPGEYGLLALLACGYNIWNALALLEDVQYLRWSEDWDEVTCKTCLRSQPR